MRISSRVLGLLVVLMLGGVVGVTALPAQAQSQLVANCALNLYDKQGNFVTPGFDCVLQQFLSIARFILAITGSVALVIFVYTGFMYIFYSSQPEKNKHYTELLQGAALGIVIIFCSGLAVSYFDAKIRGKDDQDCYNQGPEYSCTEHRSDDGLECIPNLCDVSRAANVQCCRKPAPVITEPAQIPAPGPEDTATGPQNSTDTLCQEVTRSTFYTCKAPGANDVCQTVGGLCEVPFESCCRPANICDCRCDINGVHLTGIPDQDTCMTECHDRFATPEFTTSGICL